MNGVLSNDIGENTSNLTPNIGLTANTGLTPNTGLTSNPLPPINSATNTNTNTKTNDVGGGVTDSQKLKRGQLSQKFSLTELMISENDRSPCYIQRQRIKSVLNELYKKVIIVGLLPDSLERHFINIFDPEVSAVVKKYLDIKNEYLIVRKTEGEINTLYLNEIIKKLKIAVRNVYRAFLFSPEAYLRLLKYQEDNNIQKTIEVQKFEKAISEILNFFYDKLDTTYEQDIKKQKEIKDIIDIELKKKEKVENYKSILKNAINERFENITEKTRQMEEYKDELEKCKLTAANNIKKIQATSKQIIDREKKLSADKKRQLNAEIILLTEKLNEIENSNKEEENAHLKKKFRIESEIENWIHKYDDEISKKQEEFDLLTKKYNEQHEGLIDLQEKYYNLKEEYRQEKEERELKRKLEEERTFKIVQVRHCALVILRFYKAYLKRKQAKMNNNKRKK